MFSCQHLYHPFLNDPGTSQDQRLPAQLSEDGALIDSREISDFLNYFAALSRQINFYDTNLAVSDWKPFFSGDLPFLLSGMAGYDIDAVNANFAVYTKLFTARPNPDGLQLLFLYSWYAVINPIQQWAVLLQNSGVALEQTLQTLIKNRLPAPIKSFISCMNTAVRCFCIQAPDLAGLLANSSWGLTADDLMAYDENFSCTIKSRRSQLLSLQGSLTDLISNFAEVINLTGSGAADQVNQNLYGLLQVSGQQDTPPHLALLYSFLDQYLNVLNDLNGLTQKHLNFFFQNVLQLSPGPVVADKAYIVFTLQRQLSSYPLPGGLSLKDGKDSKNADVFFALDAPIVITQAQAADIRTLFVNTPAIKGLSYVEGVYMAPDATKADGLTQAFADAATASWPTLGARVSEYTPPRAAGPVDYPSARIGFVLTSKVLLMNEGTRRVYIQIACQWNQACSTDTITDKFVDVVKTALSCRYLVVTQAVIDAAVVSGLKTATAAALRDYYLMDPCHMSICAGEDPVYRPSKLVMIPPCSFKKGYYEAVVDWKKICEKEFQEWWDSETGRIFPMEAWEKDIWKAALQPQRVFDLLFSGPKGWLTPEDVDMDMEITDYDNRYFLLHFYARLGQDQDAVTFYDKKALGEDLNTTDPAVKVVLNDTLKMDLEDLLAASEAGLRSYGAKTCCLSRQPSSCGDLVSFYEFFRNVIVLGSLPDKDGRIGDPDLSTYIHVSVCGVKTLVVQNDDNVLNVKKPFTPFGVKPIVPDFDIRHHHHPHPGANLVGPNFYVGSAEVFLKKWDRVDVNLNWKGKPAHLHNYYEVYLQDSPFWTRRHFPRHQVNLSVLQAGDWEREAEFPGHPLHYNKHTKHWNRRLFPYGEQPAGICADKNDYQFTFRLTPRDFGLDGELEYDPTFAPLTSYADGVMRGFVRMTLENQDFLHKLYTAVMAEQIIARIKHPGAPMPNEPWTPIILNMSIDYEATAFIEDLELIQLYPYTGTYKSVDIGGQPSLLACFCDEGTLFIGLSGLQPGDGLHILFELAEATADTEGGMAGIVWQYLAGNQWQDLRTGFEIVADSTNGLSTTGILQLSFPNDISNNNTVMPAPLYWIKAAATGNTAATSQTMAILTQAALASFTNNVLLNDQNRPATPLPAGSITKLQVPDASVAKVNQPYDSFGGQAPEIAGDAYALRISEQLRHKGRAIQKWDYERMVLQQYPKLLRVKCINHSYSLNSHDYKWDFPMAPGSVIIAVLPDPAQLKVADTARPTVPMSMLNEIETWLAGCTSPFVQLFVKNPRYEPVDICLTVTLQPGADTTFSKAQLQQDIQHFMAPWLDGNFDAFEFAQRFYRSDLVQFIESRDYIGYVLELEMSHQGTAMKAEPPDFIDPLTPRSILVAGTIVVNIPTPKTSVIQHRSIKNKKGNVSRH